MPEPQTAIPIRQPSDTSADDTILPFEVKALDLRGRVVRLGPAVDTILRSHDYPAPVARLLGEAIVLIVAFQVTLSFGEALWSPRLYDYTATVAPPGKEASYMALSKVPMFFAKVAAGPATGFLLAWLCPEEGLRNTELMWLIVGGSTLLSPITLLLGRRWLDVERRREKESGREQATAS